MFRAVEREWRQRGYTLSASLEERDINRSTRYFDTGPYRTLLAHRYGSVLAGHAAKQGLAADDLVLLGSPGVDADHAGDLASIPKGHAWVVRAPDDPIRLPPDGGCSTGRTRAILRSSPAGGSPSAMNKAATRSTTTGTRSG